MYSYVYIYIYIYAWIHCATWSMEWWSAPSSGKASMTCPNVPHRFISWAPHCMGQEQLVWSKTRSELVHSVRMSLKTVLQTPQCDAWYSTWAKLVVSELEFWPLPPQSLSPNIIYSTPPGLELNLFIWGPVCRMFYIWVKGSHFCTVQGSAQ